MINGCLLLKWQFNWSLEPFVFTSKGVGLKTENLPLVIFKADTCLSIFQYLLSGLTCNLTKLITIWPGCSIAHLPVVMVSQWWFTKKFAWLNMISEGKQTLQTIGVSCIPGLLHCRKKQMGGGDGGWNPGSEKMRNAGWIALNPNLAASKLYPALNLLILIKFWPSLQMLFCHKHGC